MDQPPLTIFAPGNKSVKISQQFSQKIAGISFHNCPKNQLLSNNMCLLVIVGKYSCDHRSSSSHGIPSRFIRECEQSRRFRDCDLIYNEEDIPWLCPNCHWSYVQTNLGTLWQQTTITKCRMLTDAEFPAEPSYVHCQKAADSLESTFEDQQEAITQSAIAYHELRDEALQAYLCENYECCLIMAKHAHRPWGLSKLQEPFVRVRANADINADPLSSSPETVLAPPNSPSPAVIAPPPTQPPVLYEPGPVHGAVLARPQQRTSGISQQLRDAENENLRCNFCTNRGREEGITADARVCDECWQSQLIATLNGYPTYLTSVLRNPMEPSPVPVAMPAVSSAPSVRKLLATSEIHLLGRCLHQLSPL